MEQKTLTCQCFDYIHDKISKGDYLPRKKLAVVALAKEIGVGPTPVREALSRLTQTGLVEVYENRGFKVTALSENELKDLYHTYLQIEGLATAQAMERGDDEWASRIVAALYQLSLVEDAPLTYERYAVWAERNARFHAAIVSGAGSPFLLNIRNQLFMQFDRYLRLALNLNTDTIQIDHNDHKLLADVVIKRDKSRMFQLLEEQVEKGLAEIIYKLKLKNILQ